jgi:hypothetical protein
MYDCIDPVTQHATALALLALGMERKDASGSVAL